MDEFTMETLYQIWNDKTGECVEVGEDRDSLGLVEIRTKLEGTSGHNEMTFSPDQALLIADALQKVANTLKGSK